MCERKCDIEYMSVCGGLSPECECVYGGVSPECEYEGVIGGA